MDDQRSKYRDQLRQTWATSNYAAIAYDLKPIAQACVQAAQIQSGTTVLDVATGSGNTALLAARAGGRVTGLDLVPELLAVAKERAGEQSLDVTWTEGDAEAMPFADRSFDRVLSTLGVVSTSRPSAAVKELGRVCKPDGRIVLGNWSGSSFSARAARLIDEYFGPRLIDLYTLWGEQEHLAKLFEPYGISISVQPQSFHTSAPSPAAFIAAMEENNPLVAAPKKALEEQGRWSECRTRLIELASEFDDAKDSNEALIRSDFLIVTGSTQ